MVWGSLGWWWTNWVVARYLRLRQSWSRSYHRGNGSEILRLLVEQINICKIHSTIASVISILSQVYWLRDLLVNSLMYQQIAELVYHVKCILTFDATVILMAFLKSYILKCHDWQEPPATSIMFRSGWLSNPSMNSWSDQLSTEYLSFLQSCYQWSPRRPSSFIYSSWEVSFSIAPDHAHHFSSFRTLVSIHNLAYSRCRK